MSMRVDLLKPEEARKVGAVGRKFMMSAIGGGVGAAMAFYLVLFAFKYMAVRDELSFIRERWAGVEKRYEVLVRAQAEAGRYRAILKERDGWQQARMAWHMFLLDLQRVVPETVRFDTLNGRLQWELLTAGLEKPKPGEGLPAQRLQFTLTGRSYGEKADDTVVVFVRSLQQQGSLKDDLEGVRLKSLQRDVGAGFQGGVARMFSIEASGPLRKME